MLTQNRTAPASCGQDKRWGFALIDPNTGFGL